MFVSTNRSNWYATWPIGVISWPHVTLKLGQILTLTFQSHHAYVLSYVRSLSLTHTEVWPNDLSFGSFEVIWGQTRFLPLAFDKIEIDEWGLTQCASLAKPHQLICNMTCRSHQVTSCDLELRSNFDFDCWNQPSVRRGLSIAASGNRVYRHLRILEIGLARLILLCPWSPQTWGKIQFSKILNFQRVHTGVFVSHCRIYRKCRKM